MATYVFSDVHGHVAPLARLLSRVSPSVDDSIFMLGDMIDRGPDPVGVMRLCRDLPGCVVLKGNHEDLLLDFIANPQDPFAQANWIFNGGGTTLLGLVEMSDEDRDDLVGWVRGLPLWTSTRVNDRTYLLVHAGIRPIGLSGLGECTEEELAILMSAQNDEDLTWIREEFWEVPTGLINERGEGPIVIAGHTPTPLLSLQEGLLDRDPKGEDGLARMVRLGAMPETGGVYDRWDIDCCAAGGHGIGQIMILRLDDGEEFYEPIDEDE